MERPWRDTIKGCNLSQGPSVIEITDMICQSDKLRYINTKLGTSMYIAINEY